MLTSVRIDLFIAETFINTSFGKRIILLCLFYFYRSAVKIFVRKFVGNISEIHDGKI